MNAAIATTGAMAQGESFQLLRGAAAAAAASAMVLHLRVSQLPFFGYS